DHHEQLALAVTRLSTHPVFLGHDWLRVHNPQNDWKKGEISLTCQDDHIPNLLPIEDDEDEENEEGEVNRLFQLNVESYVRILATDLDIKEKKEKYKRTFKNVVPEHYHDFKDVFEKE
ncbi:hypothetical protein L210DRAFT_829551, partial [Boletus edulis BED1]